jgi:hypothetical protein
MPTGYPDYYMNTWNPLDAAVCTFKEDFLAGLAVDGSLGEYGWRINGSASGAYVLSQAELWPNLGTIIIGGLGAANNGVAICLRREAMFGALTSYVWHNVPWDSLFVFKLRGALPKTRARVGWTSGNPSPGQPGAGVYFRYDEDAAFADTTMKLAARPDAVSPEVAFDTGLPADSNFHTLRIRSLDSGVALMSLDYGAEHSLGPAGCDVTVTLPTTNLEPAFLCSTIDATLASMSCDYAAFQSWGMAR